MQTLNDIWKRREFDRPLKPGATENLDSGRQSKKLSGLQKVVDQVRTQQKTMSAYKSGSTAQIYPLKKEFGDSKKKILVRFKKSSPHGTGRDLGPYFEYLKLEKSTAWSTKRSIELRKQELLNLALSRTSFKEFLWEGLKGLDGAQSHPFMLGNDKIGLILKLDFGQNFKLKKFFLAKIGTKNQENEELDRISEQIELELDPNEEVLLSDPVYYLPGIDLILVRVATTKGRNQERVVGFRLFNLKNGQKITLLNSDKDHSNRLGAPLSWNLESRTCIIKHKGSDLILQFDRQKNLKESLALKEVQIKGFEYKQKFSRRRAMIWSKGLTDFFVCRNKKMITVQKLGPRVRPEGPAGGLAERFGRLECIFQEEIGSLFDLQAILNKEAISLRLGPTRAQPVLKHSEYGFCENYLITPETNRLVISFNSISHLEVEGDVKKSCHFYFVILDIINGKLVERRFKVKSLLPSVKIKEGYSLYCLENEKIFYISASKQLEIQLIEFIEDSKLSEIDPILNPAIRTGVCRVDLGAGTAASLVHFNGKCSKKVKISTQKKPDGACFKVFDLETLSNHRLWSNVVEYEQDLKLHSEEEIAKIETVLLLEQVKCSKIQISRDETKMMVVLKYQRSAHLTRYEIMFYDLLGVSSPQRAAVASSLIKVGWSEGMGKPRSSISRKRSFQINGLGFAQRRRQFWIDGSRECSVAASDDLSVLVLFGLAEIENACDFESRKKGSSSASCGLLWVKVNHEYEICKELIRLEGVSTPGEKVEVEFFGCQERRENGCEGFGGLVVSRSGKTSLILEFSGKPTTESHHLEERVDFIDLASYDHLGMEGDDQDLVGPVPTPEWIKPFETIERVKNRYQRTLSFIWKSKGQESLLMTSLGDPGAADRGAQITEIISNFTNNIQKENAHLIPQRGWIIAGHSLFSKISPKNTKKSIKIKENQCSYFELQRLKNRILRLYISEDRADYLYCLQQEPSKAFKHVLGLYRLTELGMTQLRSWTVYGDPRLVEMPKSLKFFTQAEDLSSNINDRRLSVGFEEYKTRIGSQVFIKSRGMLDLNQSFVDDLEVNNSPKIHISERLVHPKTWFDFDKQGKNLVKINWKIIESSIKGVSEEIEKKFDQDMKFCKMVKKVKKAALETRERSKSGSKNDRRLQELVDYHLPEKSNLVKNWKEDQLLHFVHVKYNLLFLAVCRRDSKRLENLLNSFGYHPYLYPEGFDPFLAAIDVGDFGTLNVIKNYIQGVMTPNNDDFSHKELRSSPESFQKDLWAFMDQDQLLKTLKSGHKGLQDLIVSQLFNEDMYAFLDKIPDKSHHPFERINQYPMGDEIDVETITVSSTRMNRMDHSRIEEAVTRAVRVKEHTASVKFKSIRLQFNPGIQHQSCLDFLETLTLLFDDHLSGDLKHVVQHIWRVNKWTVVLPLVAFEWLTMTLFFVQIVLNNKSLILTGTIILLSVTELILDLMDAFRNSKNYFSVPYNYLDLIQYSSIPIISSLVYSTNIIDSSNLLVNFLTNIIVMVAGFRGITGLKIFDSLRYQIAMILQVFANIRSLLLITACSIVVFSVIEINHHSRENPEYDGWVQMKDHLYYYMNTIFGNWTDHSEEFISNRYFLYVMSGMFFSFILANLVIGVINQTFEKFEETKELVDTEQILQMLLESGYILSYFRKRGISRSDREGMCYICLIERVSEGRGKDGVVLERRVGRLVKQLPRMVAGLVEERLAGGWRRGREINDFLVEMKRGQSEFRKGLSEDIRREIREAMMDQ